MAIYYLDATNGSDTNDGLSLATAFQTVVKTQSIAVSNDTVYAYPGTYGNYTESGSPTRTGYIKWLGVGDGVNFGSMSIYNLTLADVYLNFSGINFTPEWVDPASSGEVGSDDPQYAESTQSTYAKSASCAYLTGCNYIRINNGLLAGTNRHLTPYGIVLARSANVEISVCDITKVGRGISLQNDGDTVTQFDIDLMYNHIHFITGSALLHGNIGNYYTLAEANNCHDAVVDYTEDYAPRAVDANYHGSGFAIRSGNTTIRKNIFHDGFVSAGIMCYDPDVGGTPTYENILIENNILYDISTVYLLRFYLLGPNTIIRNNTLIGFRREETDGRYEYNSAITVHTLDTNLPTLDINNNIIIGLVSLGVAEAVVSVDNNYIWSMSLDGVNFVCDGDVAAGTNTIATCSYLNNPWESVADIFAETNFIATVQHGLTLDLTLSPTSAAKNLGSAALQPVDSLGTIDSNGFIQDDGVPRTVDAHSAGAYEFLALAGIFHKSGTFNGSNNKYEYPSGVTALIDADATQDLDGTDYMYLAGIPVAKTEAELFSDGIMNNNKQMYGCLGGAKFQYSAQLTSAQDIEVKDWIPCFTLVNLADTADNIFVDTNGDNLISFSVN